MTAGASAHQDHQDLFVADFYPQLGEYLAERHAVGYDASAGRARFLAWLSEHAEAASVADPVKEYLKQIGQVPEPQPLRRIPVHMVEVINKVARARRQMLRALGREPTPDELAVELGMPPEKVIEVQKYGREPISLHTPLGEEPGEALGQEPGEDPGEDPASGTGR